MKRNRFVHLNVHSHYSINDGCASIKELLDSVSFEEIVPYIEKYHGEKGCIALYKIHYDMLRHLTPNPEDSYYKNATVSHGEPDEDWPEPHLTVHHIEGQIWEGALTMELLYSLQKDYPLMMEETRLAAYIAGMTSGKYAFIYKIDDSLEKELRINVVFYE